MVGTNEILETIDKIQKTNIDSIIISFIVAAVALMLLKIVSEAIAGYIQVRLDEHIAIGSDVEIFGHIGKIKDVSIFTVTVETDRGYIRTPTKLWRASKFLVLKNKIQLNRRKEDKQKGE